MTDFSSLNMPGNSHNQQPNLREKREKVVTGKVIQKRQGLRSKISETFTGEDFSTAFSFAVVDIVVPAIKNTIIDGTNDILQRILWGEVRRPSRNSGSNGLVSRLSYNSISTPTNANTGRTISRQGRKTHDFREIILESRGEAEAILSQLGDILQEYQRVCVADLYDLAGIEALSTDENWGWLTMEHFSTRRVPNGYLIEMPTPVNLLKN